MNPGMWKELETPYDAALARLPEALAAEGFGVITRIDLRDTFQQKLGVAFRRYVILGACNPKLALAAATEDPHVGVLLPCNVVLYETDAGRAVLGAIDPERSMVGGGPALQALAVDVKARLTRVLAAVA